MHIHAASASGSHVEVVVDVHAGRVSASLVLALLPWLVSPSSLGWIVPIIVSWRWVVELTRLLSVFAAASTSSTSGTTHSSQSLSGRRLVFVSLIIDDCAKLLLSVFVLLISGSFSARVIIILVLIVLLIFSVPTLVSIILLLVQIWVVGLFSFVFVLL